MRFYLLSFRFRFVIESLEDFGVLARVDGQHSAIQKWAIFLSDCFILIFRVYVLKYLFGVERVPIEVITLDPESRGEVVLIV